MCPARAHTSVVVTIPVKRKQVERLADTLGAGAAPVVTQASGAAADPLNVRRRRRGCVGYGRRLRRATQRGRERFGVPFSHQCGGLRFSFSCRKAGAVAGVGLFTEMAIAKRGVLLGAFTGKVLTPAQARERRRAHAKSLLNFVSLEGSTAWVDGSAGRSSIFIWLNSSRGSGRNPNVELCCTGQQITVRTLLAIAPGTELLADYNWRA